MTDYYICVKLQPVSKKINILLHPFFLMGLLLLILNDHVLKQEFHNGITGKLSDFVGLFIFPIFWAALAPKYKKLIYSVTALFFIYWKSSWSQHFLDWLQVKNLPITRVVDYTDLIALFVLPLSYYFFQHAQPIYKRSFLVTPIAIISFFAFCATSMPNYHVKNPEIKHEYIKGFRTKLSKEEFINELNKLNIQYSVDSYFYQMHHMSIVTDTTSDSCHCDNNYTAVEYLRTWGFVGQDDTLNRIYLSFIHLDSKYNSIRIDGFTLNKEIPLGVFSRETKKLYKRYMRLVKDQIIIPTKERE